MYFMNKLAFILLFILEMYIHILLEILLFVNKLENIFIKNNEINISITNIFLILNTLYF